MNLAGQSEAKSTDLKHLPAMGSALARRVPAVREDRLSGDPPALGRQEFHNRDDVLNLGELAVHALRLVVEGSVLEHTSPPRCVPVPPSPGHHSCCLPGLCCAATPGTSAAS